METRYSLQIQVWCVPRMDDGINRGSLDIMVTTCKRYIPLHLDGRTPGERMILCARAHDDIQDVLQCGTSVTGHTRL